VPEIDQADASGKPLKLSDYRGKVVVLMFSFKGCGPCEAMYPDNRQLLEAYAGRPFAILGVMGDQTIDTVQEAVADKKITWPLWWDGGGTHGPLATRWNVRGWPEIYVLDHRGTIRYRELRGEVLAQAVAAGHDHLAFEPQYFDLIEGTDFIDAPLPFAPKRAGSIQIEHCLLGDLAGDFLVAPDD